jgi:hypothetical protein
MLADRRYCYPFTVSDFASRALKYLRDVGMAQNDEEVVAGENDRVTTSSAAEEKSLPMLMTRCAAFPTTLHPPHVYNKEGPMARADEKSTTRNYV